MSNTDPVPVVPSAVDSPDPAATTHRRDAVVVLVLKGWPRLSETFIAQEIHGLEQAGQRIHIVSLRHPTDSRTHPIHNEIAAPILYLPEYVHHEPLRVLRAWWRVRKHTAYGAARRQWLRDLWRDPVLNRIRRFAQALVLVHEMPEAARVLYSHFLHTPTSVARYAALITGLPLSISAHAKDIWTIPDWEKREKLAHCQWLATCTGSGRDHLAALAPAGAQDKVKLVYHGLDFSRFPLPTDDDSVAPHSRPDGSDPETPVQIVSVGRAVPKKGYPILLKALAGLPDTLHWHFTHIGGGADTKALKAQATALGLSDRITWQGARPQADVLAAYRTADIFVLPSRINADGDRDGLPNVLMEAQSQGIACLSTAISAIPELIIDGETGVLVPPDDPDALQSALAALIADPGTRHRLGMAGCNRTRSQFGHSAGIAILAGLLEAVPASLPNQKAAE